MILREVRIPGSEEDAKQRYRFNSIEDEGDDPAKPFKKIGGHEKEGEGEGDEGEGGTGTWRSRKILAREVKVVRAGEKKSWAALNLVRAGEKVQKDWLKKQN